MTTRGWLAGAVTAAVVCAAGCGGKSAEVTPSKDTIVGTATSTSTVTSTSTGDPTATSTDGTVYVPAAPGTTTSTATDAGAVDARGSLQGCEPGDAGHDSCDGD
jgi:hypothetical protein